MKQALLRTLKALLSKWYLVVFIALLDIAFLYLFGRAYAEIFQQMSLHLNTINVYLQQSVGTLMQTNDAAALEAGLAQFETAVAAIKVLMLRVLAVLLGYWLVFEGIAWYFSYRLAGVNKNIIDYVWRFALVTLAGLALYVGLGYVVIQLSVQSFASAVPLIGQSGINLLSAIVALILAYLLLVAYSVLEKGFWKKWYAAAFKRITSTGLAYVLGLVVLFILAKILGLVFETRNIMLSLAYAVLILLPAVTALRVLMIEVIKK